MENFIEIYDDLIPKFLTDDVENICINSGKIDFNFHPNITDLDKSKHLPGMSHPFYREDGSHSKYFPLLSQILYYFSFKKNITIYEIIAARLFLTFPFPSTPPLHIHTDRKFPHWVCLYYINDSEGDTIFFDDDNNEIKRVSPKKGRIIFFNGLQLHTGSYPTKTPRFILNFNFNGKINLV